MRLLGRRIRRRLWGFWVKELEFRNADLKIAKPLRTIYDPPAKAPDNAGGAPGRCSTQLVWAKHRTGTLKVSRKLTGYCRF